jgi:predicted transcriptional regulator
MKFYLVSFFVLTVLALSLRLVYGMEVGAEAPFFKVKTGDGQALTLDTLRGKVVSLFYETREVVEKNRLLKEALKKFFREQPAQTEAQFASIPLVNCSEAVWPITKIWQFKLKENSQKEGLTIYGDWDGKMFADFGMTDNESNFLLIDKKGFIRYRAAGKIEEEETKKIIELLTNLLKES